MKGLHYDGLPTGFTINPWNAIGVRPLSAKGSNRFFELYRDDVLVAMGEGSFLYDPLTYFVLPHSRAMLESLWAKFQTDHEIAFKAEMDKVLADERAKVAAVLGLPVEDPIAQGARPAHARV